MSVGALRRRLARLDGNGAATLCPGRCGAMAIVMYDEYDRPLDDPGPCRVCGKPRAHRMEIHLIDPKPITADTPPVARRPPGGWPWGGTSEAGDQPPGPPYRPTEANRGQ